MNHTKRNSIVAIVVLTAVIGGGLWVAHSGWPPFIIRDRHYRELIGNFQRAMHRDKIRPGDENAGWEFQVQVAEMQTTAWIRAVAHMGVARIKYGDEEDERKLYKYVDYSHPSEIRIAENILYVHWTESMIVTGDWILAYDLTGRREIARRRIDPSDLRQSQ